ncbi:MAG: iron-sulfur cluster assembly accessory protein [Gammaproteobacteria bacterium]|nr:iron-sulfur cluster assembly accessory protein [Gammaproteobacteria bacterium]NIN39619.1 iron-sulfur cluster assembly accessory protein [Gammaproteobacteria bacterium]NIO25176.1 iron-sulfur cluster assembly accessory protein [Gammaproteobacteria bacterium]NIO65805.1 iron-sulfur cluster assembly accessory protein [Gammaproteobacteria bacterium]NIP45757.1 iron-sulfur cluster assembly accessory protein [Gammaproteobacteria bacterium]
MFTVTKAAASQIRHSAHSSDSEELALRVAATRKSDGAIEYQMGFDEVGVEDVLLNSRGVDVVFANAQKELLTGTVLDYVEIEPGEFRFIFLNPNDPHYRPPDED